MLKSWSKSILLFLGLLIGSSAVVKAQLVDRKASRKTKVLYRSLKKLPSKGIMFGHQDDLAYGVGWKYIDGKSDVKDITGDFPAVYGWDLGGIEHGMQENIDGVPFSKMKQYIKDSYQRGAVNTISWHLDNPVSGGNSWDTTKAVASILPGGENHEKYSVWLDKVASFMKDLKGDNGECIPIIFRPFHELNGAWFWWGKPHCSTEEYVTLWKFTVNYLKKTKRVHNLIYAYNTNSFKSDAEFMERYPGDKYADMLSFDAYQFAASTASEPEIKQSSQLFNSELKKGLSILDSIAKKHRKPSAIAETGFEAIPDKDWWTATLWDAIKDSNISYVLFWRNHGWQQREQKMHYYVPYAGQVSAPDFKKFYEEERTLFEKDIAKEQLYK